MITTRLITTLLGLWLTNQLFAQGNRIITGSTGPVDQWINDIENTISIHDDKIIIGVEQGDKAPGISDCGLAYIFVNQEGYWIKQHELYSTDIESMGRFGTNVGINKNQVFGMQPSFSQLPKYAKERLYAFNSNDYQLNQTFTSDFMPTINVNEGEAWFGKNNGASQSILAITEERRYEYFKSKYLLEPAPYNPAFKIGDFRHGIVHFYRWNTNTGKWVALNNFTTSPEVSSYYVTPSNLLNLDVYERVDKFGASLDVSDNLVVVGDIEPLYLKNSNGRIFIYKIENDNTILTGKQKYGNQDFIVASSNNEIKFFGYDVAIHSKTVAASAPYTNNAIGEGAGSVFIFEDQGSQTWNQTQEIIASDGGDSDHFGYSLALDGEFLAVGAHNNSHAYGQAAGAVYIYQKNEEGIWDSLYKWTPRDLGNEYSFGNKVDIHNGVIIASAPFYEKNGNDVGAVYAFSIHKSPFIKELPNDTPCNPTKIPFQVRNILGKTIEEIKFEFETSDENILPKEKISVSYEDGQYYLNVIPKEGEAGKVTVNIIAYAGKHATKQFYGYRNEASLEMRFSALKALQLKTPTTNVCLDEPTTFEVNHIPGMNYHYYVDSVLQKSGDHAITLSGFKNGQQVYVVGQTPGGCTLYSNSITMNVNEQVESLLLLASESEICDGDQVTFTAKDNYDEQDGIHYSFYVDDTLKQSGVTKNFKINSLQYGQSVHVRRTRNDGQCITAVSDKVFVAVQQAEITLQASATSICYGDEITFTADYPNESIFRFFVDGVLQQSGSSKTFIAENLVNGQIVSVSGSNDQNCKRNIPIKVTVFPIITVTPEQPYFQDFESTNHGWISSDEKWASKPSSWACTTPKGVNINHAFSGKTAWVTHRGEYQTVHGPMTNTYYSGEQSWVESPCFDLSALQQPLLSVQIWVSTEYQQDGTVLQYTLDNGNTWKNLGEVTSGLNWYNSNLIVGRPGSQQGTKPAGWTGNSDKHWKNARVDLSKLKSELLPGGTVRFRFAFGSNVGSKPDTERFDGFAFDDIHIRERDKVVLIEHFTNIEAKDKEELVIAQMATDQSTQVKSLHYHMDFPNMHDPIYEVNTAAPSARSLYYGIGKPGQTIIDGNSQHEEGFSSGWGLETTSKRALSDAPFDIQLEAELADQIDIKATIGKNKHTDSIQENLVCHMVIIERQSEVAGIKQSNIVCKMLPNAAGTILKVNWGSEGDRTEQIHHTWIPNFKITNPSNYEVIVFVQGIKSKEIYQTAYVPLSGKHTLENENKLDGQTLNQNSEAFKIIPNPTSGRAKLILESSNLNGPIHWEILSISGQIIKMGSFNGLENSLTLDELPNGSYLVKVRVLDQIWIKRLIILR